jgi:glycosyltransferase involved in cell wall biosynthesis
MAARAFLRASYMMLRFRPLVHVHLSSRASFWRKSLFFFVARATGRPYIVHMHGSEFIKFLDDECGRFGKAAVRSVFAHASLLIALSQQWRQNLQRISPTSSIEVLPNAVPVPPGRSAPRESAELRVLFLGRLGDRKGTFDLVRAFASTAASFANARLICAGDGAVTETQALAGELGVAGVVSCPGWLDPQAAGVQLSQASVFALPSYAEGLPMALLEAMARGLAVITTPVGGIPDVVGHMQNGMLVQPGDGGALSTALADLLRNESLRRRLGSAARDTIVQRFSIRAATQRLESIYARYGIRRTGSQAFESP